MRNINLDSKVKKYQMMKGRERDQQIIFSKNTIFWLMFWVGTVTKKVLKRLDYWHQF